MRIILGHFLTEPMDLPLADGSGDARVLRSKEKGSDINLATQLMFDAHCNSFDTAIIVTGDLDFVSPVRVVRETFAKEVWILDPQRDAGKRSKLYDASGGCFKPIRQGALRDSQFPNQLSDNKGKIHKPQDWY